MARPFPVSSARITSRGKRSGLLSVVSIGMTDAEEHSLRSSESACWLAALDLCVPGDLYMYGRPRDLVEYVGMATAGPIGEHVAIFRKTRVGHYVVVTAEDWAERSPLTIDEYDDLSSDERD